MEIEHFRPRSMLVTKTTEILKPKFPVIDAHNHLAEPFGGGWDAKPLPALLDMLDQADIRLYIDLDGGWGEDIFVQHLEMFKIAAPERFRVFGGVAWSKWAEKGSAFPAWAAERLCQQQAQGADGLKIWKPFGLHVRDERGERVRVDDERLDPIWQTAGELNLPVLIHAADPRAFFEPLDEHNERWEELHAHPDWQFPAPPFPQFATIMDGLLNLVKRHPHTTFIGAHVGCYAEHLGWVAAMLDACPNYLIDFSGRIAELGRQPYTARRFFIDYADRILFGLDAGPNLAEYRLSYRFLETDDEYFDYSSAEVPPQGRWRIYGLNLPDEVLKKIYYDNAAKLFGLPSLEPQTT